MKTATFFSLGLLALAPLPVRASQQVSGWMPFIYANAVNPAEGTTSASNQNLPSSVINAAPSTPLIGGLTTNTTMQLWDVSNQAPSLNVVNPITNGPALPAPVPESGSSILFLALSAFGLVTLRRPLRAN